MMTPLTPLEIVASITLLLYGTAALIGALVYILDWLAGRWFRRWSDKVSRRLWK